MAQQVHQNLTFVNVGVGAQATLPHNLNFGGSRRPDIVFFQTANAILVSADNQNVTVQNQALVAQDIVVRLFCYHTIEREFGGGVTNLTPQPFVVYGGVTVVSTSTEQPRTSFVFRPGGVATQNVYTTWPTLITATNAVQGLKTILFDDSLSSPCTIPAGGPYNMADTEWLALNSGTPVAITVSAGASFTDLRRFRGNMIVTNSAAGPISDFVANDQVFMSEGVQIAASGAAVPMFSGAAAPAGSTVTFFLDNVATIGSAGFGDTVVDWTLAGTTLVLSLGTGAAATSNSLAVAAGVTLTPIYRSTNATIAATQVAILGTVTPSNFTRPRLITRTANGAANAAIGEIVRCDPSGGGFTVTLPLINIFNENQTVVVKNRTNSANVITIDGNGAQTVDGAANTTIAVGFGSVTLVSDGVSNWDIA